MTWVRRTAPAGHRCPAPTSILFGLATVPDGRMGDLWRCDDCKTLWVVATACDTCDSTPFPWEHAGVCPPGLTWRPARLLTRLLNPERAPRAGAAVEASGVTAEALKAALDNLTEATARLNTSLDRLERNGAP